MDAVLPEIHKQLTSEGFSKEPSYDASLCYRGTIKVQDKNVSVELKIADLDFLTPPKIRLLDRKTELPTALAHIDKEDGLCYLQAETVVLDRYDPVGTILACLKQAQKTLVEITTTSQVGTLISEFPQHWYGCGIYNLLEPRFSGKARLSFDGKRFWLGSIEQLKSLPDYKETLGRTAFIFSYDKPLHLIDHPAPDNYSEFMDWVLKVDPSFISKLSAAIEETYPLIPAMFISAPNGCVGIEAELPPLLKQALQRKEGLLHFLVKRGHEITVTRFACQRADWDFILRRNLEGQKTMNNKKIALIGCGTIGSHLSKFLCQSGAGYGDEGRLLLVDNQELSAGNIGRHLLSIGDIGKNKALACRQELERLYPNFKVTSDSKDAMKIISDLGGYDLIIDATGDESLSIAINEFHMMKKNRGEPFPPILHVYLVGNGVAAQSLFVDGNPAYACFKCLRPDNRGERKQSPLENTTETIFVDARCGESPYLGFDVGSPIVAAALGLRASLAWAGGDPTPRLRTVRIDKDGARDIKDKNWEGSADCPACKKRQS